MGLDARNTRPKNLLRSAVEGVTFALRHGLERLIELGIDAEEVVLTGGGAKSSAWRQIVADVCNAPVTILKNEDGAASCRSIRLIKNALTASGLFDSGLSYLT